MYRLNKVNIIQDDIIIEKKPSWIGTKLTLIKETINFFYNRRNYKTL